ncbi:unnamed protein product [Rotaria sordida]|uniref:Uncharacterized protein n=1 Tax=Rotaria sordida TaxID=392033 RepID=A0A819I5M5_9BILA|nr:unnamed protein product [Rotaria sordida]CAF3908119.1 unnamed protein product [Rotaria sordida]
MGLHHILLYSSFDDKHSIMEFDTKDLNTILMNLFDENSIQADKSNDNNVCKTEPMEASGFIEQEKSSTAKTKPTT